MIGTNVLARTFARLMGKAPAPVLIPVVVPAPIPLNYAELARAEFKPVLSGDQLLSLLDQSHKLEQIRELMGLPAADWECCCVSAIRNFAETVQLAPASESHHHAFVGGLLVHTLDAIVYALKLRRKYQLPVGAGAEVINAAGPRWTYAIFCAVLLHDPGKVGATVTLMAETPAGDQRWSALNGSMHARGIARYRLSFSKAPYRLHNQVGLALFSTLLPEAGRIWLSSDGDLLQQLFASVYDVHAAGSGAIGEILIQADGMSVAANLGQTPGRGQTTGAKSIPLVDKYMRTLRQLVTSNKFVTNKPGAQLFLVKRKHQAETDSDCWILCRAAAEAVVAELRQTDASVPTAPERFYDTLQEHGMCEETPGGRAIWTCSVHQGEWQTEFSMLKFKARRLFGPGQVPAAFSGSVKPKKKPAAAATESRGERHGRHGPMVRPNAGPASNRQNTELTRPLNNTASAGTPQETDPVGIDLDDPSIEWESAPTNVTKTSVLAVPVVRPKAATTPTLSTKQADLLASLIGPVKPRKPEPKSPQREAAPNTRAETESIDSVRLAQPKPLEAAPMAVKEAAPKVLKETAPMSKSKVAAPTSATGIALAEAFFAWVKDVLKRKDTEINTPKAIFHTHEDGLLMVTPLVYQAYAESDWTEVQSAVHASSYMLSIRKRHVHHYIIKAPSGQISGKTLACSVVLPEACKVMFGKLESANPYLLGRK